MVSERFDGKKIPLRNRLVNSEKIPLSPQFQMNVLHFWSDKRTSLAYQLRFIVHLMQPNRLQLLRGVELTQNRHQLF